VIRANLVLCLLIGGCDDAGRQAVAYIPSRDNPKCTITDIVDGDTVKITCNTRGNPTAGSARLVGFDTPETYRPGCPQERRKGEQAKVYLEKRLRAAQIIAPTSLGKDRYDRALVKLELDGEDMATIMVDAGLAVRYDGGRRIDWCERLTS